MSEARSVIARPSPVTAGISAIWPASAARVYSDRAPGRAAAAANREERTKSRRFTIVTPHADLLVTVRKKFSHIGAPGARMFATMLYRCAVRQSTESGGSRRFSEK